MARPRSLSLFSTRLFATYAVVTALPIFALGLVLAAHFRSDARARGFVEARTGAQLITQTAVDPALSERPLSRGLSPTEMTRLAFMVGDGIGPNLLALRLADLSGRVVFSNDGRLVGTQLGPWARQAADGQVVTVLTRLGGGEHPGGTGARGPRAFEIYLPVQSVIGGRATGVLELFLAYPPIGREISALLAILYRDLIVGLGGLYLVLFAVTASVSSRLRREARRNAFLAAHDTLTGLPNRSSFQEQAVRALADAQRTGRPAAVALIDLDRFKAINDTLGHPNGDRVLRELAERLLATLGDSSFVARLSGDEYGVILSDGDAAATTLQQLRATLGREISIAGLTLAVQASIGYVVAPADGVEADMLLQRADVAMYAAKARQSGVLRYEPSLNEFDAASLSLVAELPGAIDDDQLVLHYQPLEQLSSGRVSALEALVRWDHPTLGLLFPDRFLPLAEQTDVIEHLTRWVLRRALRDSRALHPEPGGPRVAVNVSARSLGRGALADEVIAALAELDIEPERLIIEVTETAILADRVRAASELQRLSDAGVRISLDDFGQGQTSIGHLSALPLNELKIDRAFVADMESDPAHAVIVRSMIELGHNLGLQVVAEGVETEAVRAQLREAGSDIIQGYLLSRPLPREQIARWLGEHSADSPDTTDMAGAARLTV